MTNFKFAISFALFLLGLITGGVLVSENLYTKQSKVVQCELTGGVCIDETNHRSVCENASGGDTFIITDRDCAINTVCCVPLNTMQSI